MRNDEIAGVLEEIADMLEMSGENFFRVRAYRNAARTITDYPAAIASLTREQIDALPGIGADLAEKIATLAAGGEVPLHAELKRSFPAKLLELRTLPGLGPKRIKLLHDRLKIASLEDLRRALAAGQLRTIGGFGAKSEERLLKALENHRADTAERRWPYVEAAAIARELIEWMTPAKELKEIAIAGSLRRGRETIGDIDLLAAAADAGAVMRRFLACDAIERRLGAGETKASVALRGGIQVDLRVIPAESWGAALVYFTGSKDHGVHLRKLAQAAGLLLNEYGLFRGKRRVAGADERGVYQALGLHWIPPELREDRGEVEAASGRGHLPHLITADDLRGDLHAHSNWTDGRATIEEMARGARERGLEYFALTDHSRRLAMAHGLDPARLREQRREIERAAKHAGVTILRGIEVDILDDGALDLPDGALAELDWVVASVHSKLDQDERAMTRRMVRAIGNRNVDAIGHPSNRLIGQRPPSHFDLAEVLRAAHGEGCALEVNGQPDRLDLTDIDCLAAKRAGVKLIISSDAHHPHEFAGLANGVMQARRGWIEPDDVLNTLPVKALLARR